MSWRKRSANAIVRNPDSGGTGQRLRRSRLIDIVWAQCGDRDLDERQPGRVGLRLHQLAPDPCPLTRPPSSATVVTNAVGLMPCSRPSDLSASAESFPPLHDSAITNRKLHTGASRRAARADAGDAS